MDIKEKIALTIIVVFLLSLWCLWYHHNNEVIRICMDNLPACEAAYYSNNK
jgi:hypothetical protein